MQYLTHSVIRTVLGDIPAGQAGHTQPHEHVLSDMSGILKPSGVAPVSSAVATADADSGTIAPEFSATARELAAQPVTLENYDAVRREVLNVDNLRLCSQDDAVVELRRYLAAGGQTVVDSSSRGMGRDHRGLAAVSKATGVNIVMGSGYYSRQYHPAGLDAASAESIADEIVADVEVGVNGSGIRSGVIGEIGLSWPVHPTEEKVLEAACQAQRRTGAVLQIHPGRDPHAPMEAMKAVERAGGDPSRSIMSHVDRTLWERSSLLELAGTGCYLELDLFGQESSYYAFNPEARRPNDRTRIEWILALREEGHGSQVLIAQDICQKVYLRKYGGPGYSHILDNVIPLMRRMGLTNADIRELTHHNPASALAMEGTTR